MSTDDVRSTRLWQALPVEDEVQERGKGDRCFQMVRRYAGKGHETG